LIFVDQLKAYPPVRMFYRSGKPGSVYLHVYLEGDGKPWRMGGRWPAINPKANHRLALALMAKDRSDRVYLNRPCYGYSWFLPPECHEALWLDGRYGKSVVEALSSAIDNAKAHRSEPYRGVVLIGHSGGGNIEWMAWSNACECLFVAQLCWYIGLFL